MAGLMSASPKNSAAPIAPIASSPGVGRPSARCASASSDSVPPSPLVVRAQQDQQVFDRDDDRQCPQDQRQQPQRISGTLTIVSPVRDGRGTTVRLVLPIAEAA
jgi:hypothetical protein